MLRPFSFAFSGPLDSLRFYLQVTGSAQQRRSNRTKQLRPLRRCSATRTGRGIIWRVKVPRRQGSGVLSGPCALSHHTFFSPGRVHREVWDGTGVGGLQEEPQRGHPPTEDTQDLHCEPFESIGPIHRIRGVAGSPLTTDSVCVERRGDLWEPLPSLPGSQRHNPPSGGSAPHSPLPVLLGSLTSFNGFTCKEMNPQHRAVLPSNMWHQPCSVLMSPYTREGKDLLVHLN